MKFIQKIVFFPLILLISFSYAQEKKIISIDLRLKNLPFGLKEYIPANKPILGLALSGGGARGIAQIGVLKALEEERIETEIIVGTSMGSIVGGLYSSGYSVDELDSILTHTDWDELLSLGNETSRRELFVDQKITDDRALLTLRLEGLKLIIPTSLSNGQKLSNYLYLLASKAPVHPKNSFDDLWKKFRAVCTDLISGKMVVIDRGSLGRAMRASSSVSFLLKPIKWDDWLLVDGGLVSNIPVGVVKQYGVDLVIAVNTTSPLRTVKEIDLPWEIADQVVSIPIKKLNDLDLTIADIVITPQLNNRTATNFVNVDSLIHIGYNNTLLVISSIKSKIDSVFKRKINQKEFYVKNIIRNEQTEKDLNLLINKYLVMDSILSTDIIRDLVKLYESGKYNSIRIELTELQDSTEIEFIYKLNPVVKQVKTIGITQVDSVMVNTIISSLNNKPYNEKLIALTISSILKKYRQKGYLLADFKSIDFDELTGALLLYFDEGLISEIQIEGNYTEASLITREIPLKAGDYFVYDKVKRALDNLRSTGFFNDINMYVVEEKGQNILKVIVDEKISSVLRLGFLLDETYNAQFSLDIRDENLFGTGTDIGLFLYGGASNRAYIFELKNHRILKTYLTYNISAYYKFSDIDVYQDKKTDSDKTFSREKTGEYRQIFYGASLSLGTQIEKFGNLIFTGKYQIDEVKNILGAEVEPFKTTLVSVGINAVVDNMDRYPYPQQGLYFRGFYETAQSFLGGDEGFTNIGFDSRYFFKIGERSTIVPRLKIGFGDETLPLSEQYLLGGMDSFFGMRQNEFRGRQIFLTSLMYRIELPFQIFFNTYLKFRYDLGSTWDVPSQIKFKDLRHGIGAVISFDTPIGPADFGIGRSFLLRKNLPDNPISWGDVVFYFSLGYKVNISPSYF